MKNGLVIVLVGVLFLFVDLSHKFFGEKELVQFLNSIDEIGIVFGIGIIFVSLIETLFVVSFYLPGSLVLLVLAASFRGDIVQLEKLLVYYWVGVSIGVWFNYLLGRYSRNFVKRLGHKDILNKAQNLFSKFGYIVVSLFSIHPNYIGTLFLSFGLTDHKPKYEIGLFLFSMILSSSVFVIFINKIPIISSTRNFPISSFQFSLFLIGLGTLVSVASLIKRK